MLEKALNRGARRNYHDRSQYPEVFFEIETILDSIHAWIKNFKFFCNFKISIAMLGLHIEEIGQLIKRLTMTCSPEKGKKKVKISVRIHEHEYLDKSIADMMFILRTGIICAFHKLPLPAGEGWGGGSKT